MKRKRTFIIEQYENERGRIYDLDGSICTLYMVYQDIPEVAAAKELLDQFYKDPLMKRRSYETREQLFLRLCAIKKMRQEAEKAVQAARNAIRLAKLAKQIGL